MLRQFNKNIYYALLASFLFTSVVYLSCQKSGTEKINLDKTIQAFFESPTFLRHRSYIENFGTISYSNAARTKIAVNNTTDSFNLIFVPIMNGKVIVGTLQVVELKSDAYLPNKDAYALNFMYAKELNYSTLSGKIKMIDLNYDNYTHSNIIIENNVIKSWKATGLPITLSDKYPRKVVNRVSTNSSNPVGVTRAAIYGLCDSDHNNDVSWSECMSCATNAITADGFSLFVCGVSSFNTAWAPWWGSCIISVAAACVFVSASY